MRKELAIVFAAVLLPLAAQAGDGPRPSVPQVKLPALALPALDEVKRPIEPASATPVPAGPPVLEKAEHGRDFDANLGGRKARGGVLREFRVRALPTTTESFQTLVRIRSPGGKPLRLVAKLQTPRGETLADAATDVSYPYGKDVLELVLRWDGIAAKTAGTYAVALYAGEQLLGKAPIEVVFGE